MSVFVIIITILFFLIFQSMTKGRKKICKWNCLQKTGSPWMQHSSYALHIWHAYQKVQWLSQFVYELQSRSIKGQLYKVNASAPATISNLLFCLLTDDGVARQNGFKAGPPWFEFLVIFDFFAPWYRKVRGVYLVWKLHKNFEGKVGQMCHRSCSLV